MIERRCLCVALLGDDDVSVCPDCRCPECEGKGWVYDPSDG